MLTDILWATSCVLYSIPCTANFVFRGLLPGNSILWRVFSTYALHPPTHTLFVFYACSHTGWRLFYSLVFTRQFLLPQQVFCVPCLMGHRTSFALFSTCFVMFTQAMSFMTLPKWVCSKGLVLSFVPHTARIVFSILSFRLYFLCIAYYTCISCFTVFYELGTLHTLYDDTFCFTLCLRNSILLTVHLIGRVSYPVYSLSHSPDRADSHPCDASLCPMRSIF